MHPMDAVMFAGGRNRRRGAAKSDSTSHSHTHVRYGDGRPPCMSCLMPSTSVIFPLPARAHFDSSPSGIHLPRAVRLCRLHEANPSRPRIQDGIDRPEESGILSSVRRDRGLSATYGVSSEATLYNLLLLELAVIR